MKRHGTVIGLRPEKLDEYRRLHAAVWPGVLKMIKACHIRNYSIYLRHFDDERHYLFSYFEYTGRDFASDMAKMAACYGLLAGPGRRALKLQVVGLGPTRVDHGSVRMLCFIRT